MGNLIGRNTKASKEELSEGTAVTNGLVARRGQSSGVAGFEASATSGEFDAIFQEADNVLTNAGFSGNDAQGIRFAIAQNVQKNGAGAVVDNMRTRLEKTRNIRNKVIQSYATLGADVPDELAKRLDDLDKVNSQISVFGMTGEAGAQFTAGFQIEQLLTDESDLIGEIQQIAGPALARDDIVNYQKGLAEISSITALARERNASAAETEEDSERKRVFGILDSVYAGSSRKELMTALRDKDWNTHNVERRLFGEYVNDRIITALDAEKTLADIAAKRSTASSNRRQALDDQMETKREIFLGNQNDAQLKSMINLLQTNDVSSKVLKELEPSTRKAARLQNQQRNELLKNLNGFGVTLNDLLKHQGARAKGLKDYRSITNNILSGDAAFEAGMAQAEELDLMQQLSTGVVSEDHAIDFMRVRKEIEGRASSLFSRGTNEWHNAVATGLQTHVQTQQPVFDSARETLTEVLPAETRVALKTAQRNGMSITMGSQTLDSNIGTYVANHHSRMGFIDPNRGLSNTGQRFKDFKQIYKDSLGVEIDLSESFKTQPLDTLSKLMEAPSGIVDDKKRPVTIRNAMRQGYEGDVKAEATRMALSNLAIIAPELAEDESLRSLAERYIDFDNGEFKREFISSDGHPNIRRILLDAHMTETGVSQLLGSDKFFNTNEERTQTEEARQRLVNSGTEAERALGVPRAVDDFDERDAEIGRVKRQLTTIQPTTRKLIQTLSVVSDFNNPTLKSALYRRFTPTSAEELAAQAMINPVRQSGVTKLLTDNEDGIITKEDKPVIDIAPYPRQLDINAIVGSMKTDIGDGVEHLQKILNETSKSEHKGKLSARVLQRRFEDTGLD